MTRGLLPIALSVLMSVGTVPLAFAGDSQLNFKIYSPDGASTAPAAPDEAPASSAPEEKSAAAAPADKSNDSATVTESKPELTKEVPEMSAPATSTAPDTDTAAAPATAAETSTKSTSDAAATTSAFDTTPGDKPAETTAATTGDKPAETAAETSDAATTETASAGKDGKTLQGYVREVPAKTRIPIIMDTAVDSDTSQEGDEFAARTSEDLNINGAIVVPAGSIIKGRIAQLNAPKHFTRGGSVALKFDTVTTPDNRSIPLVANLVASGGVVHARRGLKDYAIDSGTVAAPLVVGALIGLVAGKSNNNNTSTSTTSTTSTSKSMSKGAAMALGTGIGLAVGIAILCAKKGKKVDVRPGDELKIELAEALRMPMM